MISTIITIENPISLGTCVSQISIQTLGQEHYLTMAKEHFITIPQNLAKAVSKRRAEYISGRYCAKYALKLLGYPGYGEHIPIHQLRYPDWPTGIIGSITHKEAFTSAAVGYKSDLAGIGIDAENYIGGELANRIETMISGKDDVESLMDQIGLDRNIVLTIIFSAKESIFKCYFPLFQSFLNFSDVKILQIDSNRGTFLYRLLVDLGQKALKGYEGIGSYALKPDGCYTAVTLKDI